MTARQIEAILNTLKVDSIGRIIGKSKAINKIQSLHLSKVDNDLTDVRVQIMKRQQSNMSKNDSLEALDEFIYNLQTK